MIDTTNQRPIRVSGDNEVGPYIKVTREQLDRVREVLDRNRVPYWVESTQISIDGGKTFTVWIQLARSVDIDQVQHLLDDAE